jgi:anti-sigma factor RsiW
VNRDCRRLEELLGRFLDGELDEQQSAWVARHLDDCPECRHKLAEFEAVDRLFREKDEPPRLAEEYWDWHRNQVWSAIRTDRRRRWEGARTLRFTWIRAASVAAGAAVVLLAAIGGWRVLQRYGAAPMTVAEEPRERGAGVGAAAETRTGGRQATAPASRAAGPKAALMPRVAGGAGESPAGPTVATDEIEAEALADADGSLRNAAEDRGPAEETTAEVGGLAGARGQTEFGESVALAAKQAPTAPGQAGVVSGLKKEGWVPVEDMAACDTVPEVIDIGLLPRVPADETATVFLRALVEPDGSVSSVELEGASGNELLDSIAFRNVQQARFRAGYFQGEPVRCWVKLAQQFEAETPAETAPEPDSE